MRERFIILNQQIFADLMQVASTVENASYSKKIFQECRVRENGFWEEGFIATVFLQNERLLIDNIPTTSEDLLDDLMTGSFFDFFPIEQVFVSKTLFGLLNGLLKTDNFSGFIIDTIEMNHKVKAKIIGNKEVKVRFSMLGVARTLTKVKKREA